MNPTKRVAYFDPFSGASGDMILGALIDAGASIDDIRDTLESLVLGGYSLEASPFSDRAVNGTQCIVIVDGDQPSRTWAEIRYPYPVVWHVSQSTIAGVEMVRVSG